MTSSLSALLPGVAKRAQAAGVFASVSIVNDRLLAGAQGSAEPAEYRVFTDEGKVWVALTTAHRWLSQSIEADLVHTGDKIEELLEEELVNLGWTSPPLPSPRLTYEHFRDQDKLYTFRTAAPLSGDAQRDTEMLALLLLGYEATFRPLGDMEADDEEE